MLMFSPIRLSVGLPWNHGSNEKHLRMRSVWLYTSAQSALVIRVDTYGDNLIASIFQKSARGGKLDGGTVLTPYGVVTSYLVLRTRPGGLQIR